MGTVLEEAPPELGGQPIVGEVPGSTEEVGDILFDRKIREFLTGVREIKENSPEGAQVITPIPDKDRPIPHQVPLEELTLRRDKKNRRFFASFGRTLKGELEEHKTVALSITAAGAVIGGLYTIKAIKDK